jgi:hypothetical protein
MKNASDLVASISRGKSTPSRGDTINEPRLELQTIVNGTVQND